MVDPVKAVTKETPTNPTVPVSTEAKVTRRIPMSVPVQKLQVPQIPGYHLHWMEGTPERLAQALQAGYVFVDADEVNLNQLGIATAAEVSGNTDMGTRVSIVAGGSVSAGQALRAYLMKIEEALWLEDQKVVDENSARTVEALTAGMIGAGGQGNETMLDQSLRYVDSRRTKLPDFFKRKTRSA